MSLLLEELPKLRGTALFLTRRTCDADDLVQETAVRAIAAQHQFTIGTNLRAWLHRIMRNEFIDLCRRTKSTSAIEDVPEIIMSADATQEGRIVISELFSGMTQLSVPHLETLLLICARGLSYQEVADIQGCSVGTVKSRTFRAREQLKAYLLGETAKPRAIAKEHVSPS